MARVVCAANKFADGTIILGTRHWDEFMHYHAECLSDETLNGDCVQGFVDSDRNFLTREEAWVLAIENNQITRTGRGFEGPELFSENLY